jgi:hypothetical protein
MMVVDFQHERSPVVRWLLGAGPVPEVGSSYRREIASKTQLRRPDGRLSSPVGGRTGQKGGVHNVHTLGFGSGRTGAGLGRIADVCGGVADLLGLEPGSSPTSGTVLSLQGLVGL